ncbi:MAG: hypothetical protein Q607_CBUC00038G0007 [Clostridium butyricum DORA_1]|nr:MAG: hypothetical protein Q607_CBUC00038G0007 [Clostridium butyricum DORA_1]MDU1509967.1 hypothetical protein [Clostridium butyricum]
MENVLNQNLTNESNVKCKEVNSDITKCEEAINEVNSNNLTRNISLDDIFNSNLGEDDLTFTLTREAKIPEGEYPFVLRRVHRENNQTTSYGLKDQIVWEYEVTDLKENKILLIDKNNISCSDKSKFKKNLKRYCEVLNLTKINLKDLIGIKGRLKIQHNTDDEGNIYENIVEIYPTSEFENVFEDGETLDI